MSFLRKRAVGDLGPLVADRESISIFSSDNSLLSIGTEPDHASINHRNCNQRTG